MLITMNGEIVITLVQCMLSSMANEKCGIIMQPSNDLLEGWLMGHGLNMDFCN
jgi:hypothetical protein